VEGELYSIKHKSNQLHRE